MFQKDVPCRPGNEQQSQALSGSPGSMNDEDHNGSGSWLVDDDEEEGPLAGREVAYSCKIDIPSCIVFWHCSMMFDHSCSRVYFFEAACSSQSHHTIPAFAIHGICPWCQ